MKCFHSKGFFDLFINSRGRNKVEVGTTESGFHICLLVLVVDRENRLLFT